MAVAACLCRRSRYSTGGEGWLIAKPHGKQGECVQPTALKRGVWFSTLHPAGLSSVSCF
jgi:hypothetical protein